MKEKNQNKEQNTNQNQEQNQNTNHLSLRADTKSTIVTTNLAFDRWGEIIKDNDGNLMAKTTAEHTVFTSEPQLWYNVGQPFLLPLSISAKP